MDGNFAALVDGAARDRGLNDYQLSAAIGLLEGNRVYSPKQVGRLRRGEVRHPDPEIVERLVQVLNLDEGAAWHAAGIWPPDLDLDTYRRFRHRLAVVGAPSDQPEPNTGRYLEWAGQRRGPERRRRDRRGLHLVPELVAA
jgi:hypothetical protein